MAISSGDRGLQALAAALPSCRLRLLNIDKNTFGAAGGHALGQALRTAHHLRVLYLSDNSLTDDGLAGLCAGLANNHTLQELCLHACRISDEGARHLGAAVASSRLHALQLSNNDISSD